MNKAQSHHGYRSRYEKDMDLRRIETELGPHPADRMKGPEVSIGIYKVRLPDFRKVVKRGAKMLDMHMPGWWQHIDTSALDLRSEEMCVLGQTWQHYDQGKELLAGSPSRYRSFASRLFGTPPADEARNVASRYGFDISKKDGQALNYQANFNTGAWAAAWEHLTTTWLEEIRKRQEV